MRSSFSRLSSTSSDEGLLSPSTPHQESRRFSPTIQEDEENQKEFTNEIIDDLNRDDEKTTSNTTSFNDEKLSDAPEAILDSINGHESKTPTNHNSFDYLVTDDSGNDNAYSCDQGSDTTKDSCYGDRRSTYELQTDTDDGFEEHASYPPRFLTELPEEVNVIEGDCARFDARIDSDPLPRVTWFRDGEILNSSGRFNTLIDGNKYSLLIRNVKACDDAEYECRAVNDCGEVSSFGELYVISNM